MAVTRVQGNTGSGATVTTVSVSFAAGTAAASGVIVDILLQSTARTVSSVTDDKSNTYTLIQGPIDASGVRCYQYKAENVASGTLTVTVNLSGSTTVRVHITEFSGVPTSGITDGSTSGAATVTGTTATTSPNSITTTNANDLLHAFVGASTGVTFTAGDDNNSHSYTITTSETRSACEELTLSATESAMANATLSASVNWVILLVAIQPAASGPTPKSDSDSATLANQVAIALGDTDSATLAEQLAVGLGATDSTALAEQMKLALGNQDTATLQELVSLALAIADAASLSENATVTTGGGNTPSSSDSGTLTDTGRIGASTSTSDIGTLAEQAAIKLGATDLAAMTEQIGLGLIGADSAALVEQLKLALSTTDTASLAELQTAVQAAIAVAEAMSLGESATVTVLSGGARDWVYVISAPSAKWAVLAPSIKWSAGAPQQ